MSKKPSILPVYLILLVIVATVIMLIFFYGKQSEWLLYSIFVIFALLVGYQLWQWQLFIKRMDEKDNLADQIELLGGDIINRLTDFNREMRERIRETNKEFEVKFNDAREEFIQRMNKLDHKREIFQSEWAHFRDKEWAHFRDDILAKNMSLVTDLQNSRNRALSFLDKFSHYKHIAKALQKRLDEDLALDEYIGNGKKLHEHIYDVKYGQFLSEHFVYEEKERMVSEIPSYYFKTIIWQKFIQQANCYYSVQLLYKKDQENIYLSDDKRADAEIYHLLLKTEETGVKIQKLFVLNDDHFNGSGILKEFEPLKKYLKNWHDEMKSKYSEDVRLMYIPKSKAEGIMNGWGDLEDIGIFGDIYGIQRANKNANSNGIFNDELKIEFCFDKNRTEDQKTRFLNLIKRATPLSELFTSDNQP
ncbi:hypothetical protein A4D02_16430 [Niastella koreensis]|uniref:Uncharacterized protein n=2 Tax=Niastella koreensis TaxID=354356 RepID=G8TLU0_NIAKG|nr:hypothetical protein [Niastella koreensis]AEV97682.1 hypothetical protein Niako_1311 [Niastella koreensis GR20-10]OQP40496.1 hypothetical protein A4D02_16430 [Niastella koreensis]